MTIVIIDVVFSVGVTSGKWLVHISPADVDRVWHDVATSMVNKSFGPNVLSAKVCSNFSFDIDLFVGYLRCLF